MKKGYARHFLFPKKWAMVFTKGRQSEAKHRQSIIESKKKKAIQERKSLADKLKDIRLTFIKQVDSKGHLFGSVNAFEISKQLEEKGYYVDKKSIRLSIPIKEVGSHKVVLQWNSDLKTDIEVMIKSSHPSSEKDSGESKKETSKSFNKK